MCTILFKKKNIPQIKWFESKYALIQLLKYFIKLLLVVFASLFKWIHMHSSCVAINSSTHSKQDDAHYKTFLKLISFLDIVLSLYSINHHILLDCILDLTIY